MNRDDVWLKRKALCLLFLELPQTNWWLRGAGAAQALWGLPLWASGGCQNWCWSCSALPELPSLLPKVLQTASEHHGPPGDPKSSISLSYAPSRILLAGARRLLLNTEGNQPEWQGSQPRCCTSHGRMRPRREGKSIPCYPPARPTKRRHPQACG